MSEDTRASMLPCPFCESEKAEEDFGDESAKIRCRDCGAQSGRVWFTEDERESDDFTSSESSARAIWNRRDGQASRAAQWQDISTAPRDGTELLLWREDCGQFIGSYTSGDNFPLTQDEIDMMAEEVLFAKDWFTQWPDAQRLEGCEVPTHWMPLPTPPVKGA